MLNVGITGGIGSGKTTVCRFFEFLDIPVYYADKRAKELMVEDVDLIQRIKSVFGEESYFNNGDLNKNFLAEKVFHNEDKLKMLNSLVHPAVWKDSGRWMQTHADVEYTLYEAAVLFESGSYKMFDKTITVYAPEALRINRVIQRDNVSSEDVKARIGNQMDEERKIELADYVIYNDLAHSLVSQVLKLHGELIRL